ncbi:hypothetical protein ACW6QP_00190 [Salegentibacter sp. HM20]
MKNILIPTDFTVESLEILKTALREEEAEKVNITLVYGANISTSISDLLFFSKSACISKLREDDFCEALAIIENKFSEKIHHLDTDIFTGGTKSAFINFLEANQIEKVYVPRENNALSINRKNGFNLVPYLKKSNLESCEVDYTSSQEPAKGFQLSRLLMP